MALGSLEKLFQRLFIMGIKKRVDSYSVLFEGSPLLASCFSITLAQYPKPANNFKKYKTK